MKRYDKRSYDTRAAIGLSLQPLILCLSFYTYAICESSTFSTYTHILFVRIHILFKIPWSRVF